MRNFKKLASLLAVALVIFGMLALASCGGDGDTDASSGTSSSKVEKPAASAGNSTTDSQKPDESVTDSSKDDATDSSTESSTTNSSTDEGSTNSSTAESSKPDDGNDEANPNLVKVTVLNQLGKPVSGATIQICQDEVCFNKPIQTGADGTGSREYTLSQGNLKA